MAYMIIRENGKHEGSSFYHIGDGYHYHFHRESEATIYFRCKKSSCRGRALLKFGHEFQHTAQHNHAPDVLYTQVLMHRQAIMSELRSMNYVSFIDIIRAEKRRVWNPEVRSRLTLRSLRSSMQRARSDVFPRLPGDLAGLSWLLENPEWAYISSTLDFQDSIYLGSVDANDGSHSVVFISCRCLGLLATAEILFADGTFYITPSVNGCYQVFTIVTIEDHTVIPLCWCLMDSKSQAAYESVLLLLRANLPQYSFTKVVSDFEDAIMNAFRNVFVGIVVQGCLFHSASAMAKQAKGLIGLFLIRSCFIIEVFIRLCCALPLLPQNLIQRGLNIIGTAAMDFGPLIYNILRPFLAYVQHDWLDHVNRGPTLSVCQSLHRTNNASESNNSRMNRKFGVHHPNIFHFIRQLTVFEQESIDDVYTLRRGLIPTRHRSVRAISNDEFISRITRDLLQEENPTDIAILSFLSGASMAVKGITDNCFA